jgi:hypothetical protein
MSAGKIYDVEEYGRIDAVLNEQQKVAWITFINE